MRWACTYDGQPRGRRQVDSDAARHVPAEAVLRRRQTTATTCLGHDLHPATGQRRQTAPLSDEDLVGELEKLGMKVARRTVIKYRQTMGIPSSPQRRDWSERNEEAGGSTPYTR